MEDDEDNLSEGPQIVKDNELIERELLQYIVYLNHLASRIFIELPFGNKNHVICPVLLFSSFAMLSMGARGETETDLNNFLVTHSYLTDKSLIFKACKTLQSVLQVLVYEPLKLRPNYELITVFRLLLEEKAKYSEHFKILIKRYLNVDIDTIDFENDFDIIKDQITQLIRTEFKSNDIHDFNLNINENTQLVILSAVHFKSKWDIQFPVNDIKEEYFYNESDRTAVQMMAILGRNWRYAYIMELDSHVVEIPFASESLAFIMILPRKRDGMDRLWEELNYDSILNATEGLYICRCDIFLPKFRLECDYDLTKFPKMAELRVFYNEFNDLSDIGGEDHPIKPNNILHKVVFEISDIGQNSFTRGLTSSPVAQIVKADHPFVFVVKDNRTKTWVFMGKVHSL